MPRPGVGSRRRRADDPLAAFLAYLVDIELALTNRNWAQLAALLRKRRASHIPREVREELLMLSRTSRDSFRAPVQFLRFQHRMMQLAMGGDTLPVAQTELRLDREPPLRIRRPDLPRRSAARDGGTEDEPESDAP